MPKLPTPLPWPALPIQRCYLSIDAHIAAGGPAARQAAGGSGELVVVAHAVREAGGAVAKVAAGQKHVDCGRHEGSKGLLFRVDGGFRAKVGL
jgi:hypothetical protein